MSEKEKFEAYVKVQNSGVTNMFDVTTVCRLSGLERKDAMDIMERYEELMEKYPVVVK